MNEQDNATINMIRQKSRFVNKDLDVLKSTHKKLIGGFIDWNCPNCVRKAIDQLITLQSKYESKTDKSK